MFVRTAFPRAPRCYLLDTADWQAHFLALRVQKTISRWTLIVSQAPLANSACLLRVIGFSHLLLKVKQMSFLPCGPLSRNWNPQPSLNSSEVSGDLLQNHSLDTHRLEGGPERLQPQPQTCLKEVKPQSSRLYSSSSCQLGMPGCSSHMCVWWGEQYVCSPDSSIQELENVMAVCLIEHQSAVPW